MASVPTFSARTLSHLIQDCFRSSRCNSHLGFLVHPHARYHNHQHCRRLTLPTGTGASTFRFLRWPRINRSQSNNASAISLSSPSPLSSTTTPTEDVENASSDSLSDLGHSSRRLSAPSRPRFFPDGNANSVGYWLLASAASVFGLVGFGGLTRLTESG